MSHSRGSSNEFNDFSQRTQHNFQQGAQRPAGETRSSHLVQRTKPVTMQGTQHNPLAGRKKSVPSNPITPLDPQKQSSQSKTNQSSTRAAPSIWGTLGALLVVISIILVSAKLFKKHHPLASANLPREVMEVLGKKPLDARQTIHFVRCGSRILILGSSPAGLEMLSEVQDPVEVDLITGMCRERAQSARSNSTFLNLFQSAQAKTEQNERNPAESRFPQSVKTQPDQPVRESEQEDFADYDSAVTRLQQKLMHSSRQSLNEDVESGHA
ncbi:FliO/MopB family protein [Gimesia alba]|uniref:FliO/MopB family protein n=1 Tax=Gimesia alba TaxID=2527973 RepID=UPI0018DA0DB0|nr:flagellar biosynthetic protein FliO [Gimesia alba]